ncbi:short chain dehydrogenase [Dictyobacter alpinus]|uniref:Short chain dehydrogenase n=1 Tax=Dictyobacter alpinus TaxID=2014873 RepID=A0A402BB94_9CHLR|nr:SDR family oxidoreductase [Dictyobacter alpinus]GCE28698.1 short chain dehydrogenase [Dictyobacter alpinus]
MSTELTGKTVVIIGASSGMGRAVAAEVAARDAHTIMVSRSAEKLAQARQGITGNIETMTANMLDEQSMNQLFAQIGSLDHLVMTAVADETQLFSPLATMSTEVAQRGMEKFWGTFFVVRAAVPHIAATGSITLTSSVSILNPSRGGLSVMSAASGAVAVFARTLAAELAPIRVNVVAPGTVNTGVWATQSPAQRTSSEQWARENLPVQHMGEPGELAQGFLFLMTNTYTTGVILPIDGGLSVI